MNRSDIYTTVTNTIVKAIENGQASGTFEMPWHSFATLPMNATTKKHYRGVNIPLLWIVQHERGYASGSWATYKQWKDAGAQVRKGEEGTQIVFWKTVDVEPQGDDEENSTRMFARYSTVFNAAQVDGFTPLPPEKPDEVVLQYACLSFVTETGAQVVHGQHDACYSPTRDKILMPLTSYFSDTKTATATEHYYSVLFHELTQNADLRIMPRRMLRGPESRAFRCGISA